MLRTFLVFSSFGHVLGRVWTLTVGIAANTSSKFFGLFSTWKERRHPSQFCLTEFPVCCTTVSETIPHTKLCQSTTLRFHLCLPSKNKFFRQASHALWNSTSKNSPINRPDPPPLYWPKSRSLISLAACSPSSFSCFSISLVRIIAALSSWLIEQPILPSKKPPTGDKNNNNESNVPSL